MSGRDHCRAKRHHAAARFSSPTAARLFEREIRVEIFCNSVGWAKRPMGRVPTRVIGCRDIVVGTPASTLAAFGELSSPYGLRARDHLDAMPGREVRWRRRKRERAR
jgi:hypothetical protein